MTRKLLFFYNLLFDNIKMYLINKITFICFLSLYFFYVLACVLINANIVLFLLKIRIKIQFILKHGNPNNRSHCGL